MPSLERIDSAVRITRQSAGRKSVAISTFASFASIWLIPRLEGFQRDHPDIDIRINASDVAVDVDISDIDPGPALCATSPVPPHAIRLFGEQITAVISPWLRKIGPRLKKPDDLAHFTLIEAGDAHHTHLEWLTWRRWRDLHAAPKLEAKSWLYPNYAYQMVQAALTGQGVVLAGLPLIAESLAQGDLVEPLPKLRLESLMAYWLVVGPRNVARPEVVAFCD